MAELVDALVSNTNVLGRAGSIPALGTSVESAQKGQLFSWPFFIRAKWEQNSREQPRLPAEWRGSGYSISLSIDLERLFYYLLQEWVQRLYADSLQSIVIVFSLTTLRFIFNALTMNSYPFIFWEYFLWLNLPFINLLLCTYSSVNRETIILRRFVIIII